MQNDRVGQQLGNYRLLRRLGTGGFAQVYLGEHIHLQSEAAIKVLNETTLSAEDQQGFRTEARTIRKLNHPHIVKVLEFGIEKNPRQEDAGVPYLIMEYARDGTLRDRHPRNSIVPLEQIGLYITQMAEALQYAHNQCIVHCDVKPENMLIGGPNDILLSDFGIAVTGHTSNNPSVVQKLQGTVAYVAPERLEKGIAEPTSDQYALGIIVYEWLTGVRPFEGTQDQIIYQHINTAPPPLYRVYSRVTQDIERVVMKALAKDPKQRYSSVKEFAEALSHALSSASQNHQYITSFQPTPNPQPVPANPQPQANPAQQPQPNFAQQQQAASSFQAPPQPTFVNPQAQANPPQQPKVTPVFQAPANPQPSPANSWANAAQPQIRLGSSPGQNNTTTSVFGSTSSGIRRQSSMPRGGFSGLWNREFQRVFQPQENMLELDGEFGRLRKNKAFREIGVMLNFIPAILIGVLSQPPSPWPTIIAGLLSLALFYFCIHFVQKIPSLACGGLLALYWGVTGLVIETWLAIVFPPVRAYLILLGPIFLGVSAYLHFRYVLNRLP